MAMKNMVIVLALLGLSSICELPLWPQTPSAVVTDPPVDTKFPPGIAGITVPSHRVEMDATLYLASGAGPHGTVLLLQGLPGYESNVDLAQSIRRAGWNVLLFHYRGTWGTAGTFSQASAIEDTAEAVRFLRDPTTAAKYRIDPQRLVAVGHSMGGFLAGYEASHDPGITAVAMISAVNLGRVNADPKDREVRLKRWQSNLHPTQGTSARDLFAEAEHHAKDWDYVQWADGLRTRPILLVEADDQNHADMEALAGALRQKSAVALNRVSVPTDHTFSDHRIALQTIVIEWLGKLKK
jgi:pimeloyl-ACP methyl ester carboxylesterase